MWKIQIPEIEVREFQRSNTQKLNDWNFEMELLVFRTRSFVFRDIWNSKTQHFEYRNSDIINLTSEIRNLKFQNFVNSKSGKQNIESRKSENGNTKQIRIW